MQTLIFGARSVAIGMYRAIRELQPEWEVTGFLVTSLRDNPHELEGLPVRELAEAAELYNEEEKRDIQIYIAVPEILHQEIMESLEKYGFLNYTPIHSRLEADWMEEYYTKIGRFPSLHQLPAGGEKAELSVYAAAFYKDKALKNPPPFPDYVQSILLGCAGNPDKIRGKRADFYDDRGINISAKNPDFCEMTAFYWVWKNGLSTAGDYIGIYHYRRMLDITEEDRTRLLKNQVDAVLPFPMLHLPDIREHHQRYMREEEWQMLLTALRELYPDYAAAYQDIFADVYLYNYNLLVAKKEVFADYCGWIFPLLFKTEELCNQNGVKRTPRSLAYMSESLLTLYFRFHPELRLCHTGRLLFI